MGPREVSHSKSGMKKIFEKDFRTTLKMKGGVLTGLGVCLSGPNIHGAGGAGARGRGRDWGSRPRGEPTAINNSGRVTGSYYQSANFQAFIWDGSLHGLGTLGGSDSQGYAINISDQAVGAANDTGDINVCAFLYQPGKVMSDLSKLNVKGKPPYDWWFPQAQGTNKKARSAVMTLIRGRSCCELHRS
jgi:probable HAF family extracellular repeat protein